MTASAPDPVRVRAEEIGAHLEELAPVEGWRIPPRALVAVARMVADPVSIVEYDYEPTNERNGKLWLYRLSGVISAEWSKYDPDSAFGRDARVTVQVHPWSRLLNLAEDERQMIGDHRSVPANSITLTFENAPSMRLPKMRRTDAPEYLARVLSLFDL